jgi:hypothetical protein
VRRRPGAISAAAGHARGDKLLGIGGCLSSSLGFAFGKLLVGDERSTAELFRPFEWHPKFIVSREDPLEIGITPRCTRHDVGLLARNENGFPGRRGSGKCNECDRCQRSYIHSKLPFVSVL